MGDETPGVSVHQGPETETEGWKGGSMGWYLEVHPSLTWPMAKRLPNFWGLHS